MTTPRTPDTSLPVSVIGPAPEPDTHEYRDWENFASVRAEVEKSMRSMDVLSPRRRLLHRLGVIATAGHWRPKLTPGEQNFADLIEARKPALQEAEDEARGYVVGSASAPAFHSILFALESRSKRGPLDRGWQGMAAETILAEPAVAKAHVYLRRAAEQVAGHTYRSNRELAAALEPLTGDKNIGFNIFSLLLVANIIQYQPDRSFTVLPLQPGQVTPQAV